MPARSGERLLLDVINRKTVQNKCQSLITEITGKFKPITENGKIIGVETLNGHKGFVSNESGIHILRLRGNQFEMGFQHGYLLAEKIQEPQSIELDFQQEILPSHHT